MVNYADVNIPSIYLNKTNNHIEGTIPTIVTIGPINVLGYDNGMRKYGTPTLTIQVTNNVPVYDNTALNYCGTRHVYRNIQLPASAFSDADGHDISLTFSGLFPNHISLNPKTYEVYGTPYERSN